MMENVEKEKKVGKQKISAKANMNKFQKVIENIVKTNEQLFKIDKVEKS